MRMRSCHQTVQFTGGDYFSENTQSYGCRRTTDSGYIMVRLAGGREIYEHRLVWEHECGPIPAGMCVHHLNCVKTDNRIENLALMTNSEHSRFHGMMHDRNAKRAEREWVRALLLSVYGKTA